jgi:hypothetical protein
MGFMKSLRTAAAAALLLGCAGALMAQELAVTPPNPTPIDTVRLRWTHVGCTDAGAVQVLQEANRITVSTNRIFQVDCGTVAGFFEEFTLGRLPSGEYDAQIAVNPPPGTLGPTFLIGPVHFSVGRLPATGAAAPRDDYTDLWWNPSRSGEGLLVKQSSGQLFAVWVVYDTAGRATWYSLQAGAWARDAGNALAYSGSVYRTTGPWWGRFDAPVAITAVGQGTFTPLAGGRARFDVTIEGVSATTTLERMRF